ncbi:MAG: hypothetical protein AAGF57_04145 [Pseudomonadota bacterium]
MSKFNLTFRGEIVEGHDPEEVRRRLAELLGTDDRSVLQRCFSGDPVVLRRSVERKEAAELYAKLRRKGIRVDLVKISDRGDLHVGETDKAPPSIERKTARSNRETERYDESAKPTTKLPRAASTSTTTKPKPTGATKTTAPDSARRKSRSREVNPEDQAIKLREEPATTGNSSNRGASKTRKDTSESGPLSKESESLAPVSSETKRKPSTRKQGPVNKKTRANATSSAGERNQKSRGRTKSSNQNGKASRRGDAQNQLQFQLEQDHEKEQIRTTISPEDQVRQAQAAKRKLAAEQAEQALLKAERDDEARVREEQAARDRLEAERIDKQRVEAELARQAALDAERAEIARVEAERAARKRLEAERIEQQRLEAELERQASLEAERAEKARLESKRKRAAKVEAEQAERARQTRERSALVEESKTQGGKQYSNDLTNGTKAKSLETTRQEAEEPSRQRAAMENLTIQRAASELAQNPSIKRVEKRPKTSINTSSTASLTLGSTTATKRKRQPGAANIYSLTPFRNTPEIRERADQALIRIRQAYRVGTISLLLACLLLARVLTLTPEILPKGPSGIAIAPPERLVLLAGDHLFLHDRAGVSILEQSLDMMGLSAIQMPMVFDTRGNLIAPGLLSEFDEKLPELLRCDIEQADCVALAPSLSNVDVAAMVTNPIDDSILVADASASEVIKLDSKGNIVARKKIPLTNNPVMQLDSGLLLTNSATVPGISVFRYEDGAFGEQLDEVILMASSGSLIEFIEVIDFSRNGDFWWVLMRTNAGPTPRLYRFDNQWQLIDAPPLAPGTHARELITWGNRTLVSDPDQLALQRFSRNGDVEVPLESNSVANLIKQLDRRSTLEQLIWRLGLALSVLVCITAVAVGAINRARSMVYTSCKEQGAAPVDEIADEINWVAIDPNRSSSLLRSGLAYLVLSVGLILGAIGLGASVVQLSALLLALLGPACALLIIQRSDPGHLGTAKGSLVLVDHHGMYHYGAGSRIHYRGPFLIIDDVAVFTGTMLIPGFVQDTLQRQVVPITLAGVKVDRKIITVKVLQSRHPLAVSAVVVFACAVGAIALLSLHGIF